MGQNARELLAYFVAREAIPNGGGLAAGLNFLVDPVARRRGTQRGILAMQAALAAIKAAPDNPYGDDDEAIAGAILREVQRKKGATNANG